MHVTISIITITVHLLLYHATLLLFYAIVNTVIISLYYCKSMQLHPHMKYSVTSY